MRVARQADEGWSQVDSPKRRLTRRIFSLPQPSLAKGLTIFNSRLAWSPGPIIPEVIRIGPVQKIRDPFGFQKVPSQPEAVLFANITAVGRVFYKFREQVFPACYFFLGGSQGLGYFLGRSISSLVIRGTGKRRPEADDPGLPGQMQQQRAVYPPGKGDGPGCQRRRSAITTEGVDRSKELKG